MSRQISATRPEADGRPTWTDVQAARDAAYAATNSRWHWAIDNVYAAVKALAEAGTGAAVTVDAVGAWCVEHRGSRPTSQAIRNNTRLVSIVEVAASTRAARMVPVGNRPIELAILEALGDAQLRMDLQGLLAHRRQLIVENTNLRAATTRIDAISFLSREMAEAKIETLQELADALRAWRAAGGGPAFTAEEVAGCRGFLDAGMVKAGLAIDEPSGEIVNHVQRTFAPSGVASALRRVAASTPA